MGRLKDNLVGAWQLVSYEEMPVDGSPATQPLGDKPRGYILYSADGIMAAFLSPADDNSKGDPIAYSGPYTVDEEQQVVHHRADVSVIPGWVGQTQNRKVRMEGDSLILSTADPAILSGRKANAVITWQRVGA